MIFTSINLGRFDFRAPILGARMSAPDGPETNRTPNGARAFAETLRCVGWQCEPFVSAIRAVLEAASVVDAEAIDQLDGVVSGPFDDGIEKGSHVVFRLLGRPLTTGCNTHQHPRSDLYDWLAVAMRARVGPGALAAFVDEDRELAADGQRLEGAIRALRHVQVRLGKPGRRWAIERQGVTDLLRSDPASWAHLDPAGVRDRVRRELSLLEEKLAASCCPAGPCCRTMRMHARSESTPCRLRHSAKLLARMEHRAARELELERAAAVDVAFYADQQRGVRLSRILICFFAHRMGIGREIANIILEYCYRPAFPQDVRHPLCSMLAYVSVLPRRPTDSVEVRRKQARLAERCAVETHAKKPARFLPFRSIQPSEPDKPCRLCRDPPPFPRRHPAEQIRSGPSAVMVKASYGGSVFSGGQDVAASHAPKWDGPEDYGVLAYNCRLCRRSYAEFSVPLQAVLRCDLQEKVRLLGNIAGICTCIDPPNGSAAPSVLICLPHMTVWENSLVGVRMCSFCEARIFGPDPAPGESCLSCQPHRSLLHVAGSRCSRSTLTRLLSQSD